ncbi:translocase of outer membrane 20 kDa subunit 3 [Hibiscus trionum]|uniref:Translocase of outer membrane 20 kDa subunit 3 n=1 Tax=Hibiscus trionum TaxID=183268 RepID=A0A9W7MQB6_HIBTR|nr:translocase of outer membrane 20 kDa subunit 3 [Hibiscus trionum]
MEVSDENELDRLLFFEEARKISEANYVSDPNDADNLTRWAGALLELSQCQSRQDSLKMIKDATTKLELALSINPKKHETLWCLGNAQTSLAFLTNKEDEATPYFEMAAKYFQQAVDEDPTNEIYLKSFKISSKAPELHREILKQGLDQQMAGVVPSTAASSGSKKPGKKGKKNKDIRYNIFGCIVLAIGIIVWVGFAKSQRPP